jgi:hypothetical protein
METPNQSIEEKATTRSVGMRFGLFMGGIGIVMFLIIALSGMKPDGPVRWLNVLFSGIILFLAHKHYKENGDGYMSIGQGVGIGFWAGLTGSVISSIFTYIYVKFIDAGFVDMIRETQVEAMQQKGMSEDQIENAMKIAGMFTSAEAILIFGLVFGIIASIVISLIISFFTQKKNPEVSFN